MSCNWPNVALGKYCSKIGSGATPKGGNSVYLDSGEITLIRSQNIYNEGFKSDGLVYITPEAAQKLKNVIIEPNDVLINITGDSVARVCLAPKEHLPARVNQHVAIIRVDPKEFDHRYLRYYLTSLKMQSYLLTIASSGATRNALTKSMLESLEVSKPPLDIQKKIGDVLEQFENKIQLNTQTNQTLEEMAQAIFKSWFVDFDPVKAKMNGEQPEGMDDATASLFPEKLVESELGLIPEGWEVKSLGEVSTFQNGFAFKSKELTTDSASATHKVFKMGNIRKGGGFNSKGSKDYFDLNSNPKVERYLIKKGDLLMSMTDMKNNVALLGHTALMPVSDEYLVNQRVGLIRKSDKHYLDSPFLYYQTNEPLFITDVRSRANSGVQVNLSTKGIKDTLLVVPPKEIHDAFDKQVRAFLEMIFTNDQQSEELASIRDLLLPKLLSGEIELAETTI